MSEADPDSDEELVDELLKLRRAMREQTLVINSLNQRLTELESARSCESQTVLESVSPKMAAVVICLLCLVASALFKCLLGLEANSARVDALSAAIGQKLKPSEVLLSSPKPLAPIIWIAHISIYLINTTISGLSSVLDQIMRFILPAVAVSSLFLILARNTKSSSVTC
jgi:hypothetical protein